jgi:O-antigen/teichoic acid export membrane protein
VFRWFSIVLLFATLGVSFFAVNLLDRFFPTTYYSAAPVIPVIAVSVMFSGMFVIVALGISLQRKTWLVAIFITISALLNVGLNIVLIPLYGSMGAAVATLIAYIALAVITYCVNQRIYPVPFEIGLFFIALLIGIALYTGSDFLTQAQGIYLAWGVHIGALILYGGILLSLGKLPMWKARDAS